MVDFKPYYGNITNNPSEVKVKYDNGSILTIDYEHRCARASDSLYCLVIEYVKLAANNENLIINIEIQQYEKDNDCLRLVRFSNLQWKNVKNYPKFNFLNRNKNEREELVMGLVYHFNIIEAMEC